MAGSQGSVRARFASLCDDVALEGFLHSSSKRRLGLEAIEQLEKKRAREGLRKASGPSSTSTIFG